MHRAAFALTLCMITGLFAAAGTGLVSVGLSGTLAFHGGFATALSPMQAPYCQPVDLEADAASRIVAARASGPRKRWGRPEIESFVAGSTGLNRNQLRDLATVIDKECRAYGFVPRFILSVIAIESAFTPKSVSSKGAVGLMQLRPFVAEALAKQVDLPWEGKEVLYRPETNVQLGMRYLFQLILRYQDLPLALAAYNMGPTRLDSVLTRTKEPPNRYVDKIIKLYGSL
jgi:soluble lytic murein transglycosylase-like protein